MGVRVITRQAIVDALAAVEGVEASLSVPPVITAGAAWPVWASTAWLNMRDDGPRELRWRVYVALGQATPDSTAMEADPLIEPVGQALTDLGLTVETVEPVQAPATEGGANIPLLRFTCRD